MAGNTEQKMLGIIFRQVSSVPTITELAKEAGMSRVGVWKALKKLETKSLISVTSIGSGKTSAKTAKLNYENPLAEKMLALALAEEAQEKRKWLVNFKEIGDKADFLLIYGSILNSPEKANDIDLLAVVSNKDNFKAIDEYAQRAQKTILKKIHLISLTPAELRQELEKPNQAFIDAIRKGIVLFGQEKFIKLVKPVRKP